MLVVQEFCSYMITDARWIKVFDSGYKFLVSTSYRNFATLIIIISMIITKGFLKGLNFEGNDTQLCCNIMPCKSRLGFDALTVAGSLALSQTVLGLWDGATNIYDGFQIQQYVQSCQKICCLQCMSSHVHVVACNRALNFVCRNVIHELMKIYIKNDSETLCN